MRMREVIAASGTSRRHDTDLQRQTAESGERARWNRQRSSS
jgi:hypothetical protein